MLFADTLPNVANDVHHATARMMLLYKVVWPALATLVPAGVMAAFKWAQNHSRDRRSTDLTDRISSLAKIISELPSIPFTGATPAVTPQAALTAELESAVHELTSLQIRSTHRFTGVSTFTAKVRSALLLYRPKGFAAWTLHIAFFSYLFCFLFVLSAGWSPDPTTNVSSATTPSDFVTSLFVFLTIFGLAGIPPLILRFFAARIHRRQCLEAKTPALSAAD
ncbi:MAG: hypothetical protein WBM14_14880 [Terracidiphilus sp.]